MRSTCEQPRRNRPQIWIHSMRNHSSTDFRKGEEMRFNQQSIRSGILWLNAVITLVVIVLFCCSEKVLAQQWIGPDGNNNISPGCPRGVRVALTARF